MPAARWRCSTPILVGLSLAHCIDVVEAKHVIVASELMDAFATIETQLKGKPENLAARRALGQGQGARPHRSRDRPLSGAPLSAAERRPLTIEDRALYIYTSGTTGMPKAANVNHYRVMLACFGFAGIMDTTSADRMYDCLPMYHSAGGLAATGALLVNGGSVVIRERFSAREFWDDVVRNDCTLFQYIGELCRYLQHSPPNPNETRHRLRLACGNGLRPDIWQEFKDRFRIPHILEFYAATEGNVSMFNFEGKPGAIGRIPWFLAHRFPTALVRFDVEQEQPVRNEQGFCIACAPNEVGEAIGKIVHDPKRPGARFEGYARKTEDDRKILRDVFEQGDAWFRTGDLMRKDEDGYFYFVDRIGDTFRWKGENVSTSEVAEAIDRFPGIVEANVYGVPVPGKDGRARPPTWSRSGARPGQSGGSRRTPLSTTTSAGASSSCMKPPPPASSPIGKRTPRARWRCSSCSINSRATCSAGRRACSRVTRWRTPSPAAPSSTASTARFPTCSAFSICRSCIRKSSLIRNGRSRSIARATTPTA